MAVAVDPPHPLPTPVYFAEMLKALRDDLHAGRKSTRELVEVVREHRDETSKLVAIMEKVHAEIVATRKQRESERRQASRRRSERRR